MSASSAYYPGGAENDPRAPYNEVSGRCERCGEWDDCCECDECKRCGELGVIEAAGMCENCFYDFTQAEGSMIDDQCGGHP